MKITFPLPKDGKRHDYCVSCYAETLQKIKKGKKQFFRCRTCDETHERAIIFDPATKFWLDDTREYWHAVAAVMVRNAEGKFLFFNRVQFPVGLTMPAGHVDKDESPQKASARELYEETGLKAKKLTHIGGCAIKNDQCRRGADMHYWDLFAVRLEGTPQITMNASEGSKPVWLTLDEALQHTMPPAIRYIVQKYRPKLLKV